MEQMDAAGMVPASKKGLKVLSAPVNVSLHITFFGLISSIFDDLKLSKISMSEKVSAATDWMKPEERTSVVNKDTLSKYLDH